MASPPTYVFAPFQLLPDQRALLANDRPVKLGGRAFDMLLVLVERRDRTVSKHELMDLVWPRLVVEENNLQVHMVALRKALGHQAIATVPGRGYRFTLPVQVEGAGTEPVPAAVVPAAAEPARLTNLPEQMPPLYGRDADVNGVRAMLAEHRIVTIAGAGGIGKTRLAQHAGSVARADYPQGVWWVELAALADPSLVATTVARVLGVALPSDRDPTAAVLGVIGTKRLLLILDNCEHLLDSVSAFVEAALAAAPRVGLLVTSQEVLRVAGEHAYRLGTLGVAQDVVDVDNVAASGAGALFCARAVAIEPRFKLTRDNVAGVAEICRRLDGIPLAIELAAARLPLLGVEGLRSRLSERFSVLTAGARVVLRRHQTLRAALEWSHALLSPAEQAVFRRLGVFVGGFTLESAQRVADDETIDAWDVLEHLGALVDKSMVLAEGEPLPRYRLLETTRLFALERLAEAGETSMRTERHAEAILVLLSVYDAPARRFRSMVADWPVVAAELENVRAAVGWAANTASANPMALDLVAMSLFGFQAAGLVGEGFRRLLAFREAAAQELPKEVRARYWLALAAAGTEMGRPESFEAAGQAAALFVDLADEQREFRALSCAIATSARLRAAHDIEPLMTRARQIENPDWPPRLLGAFQWARHRWLLRQGRAGEAIVCARRQVELVAASGAVQTARIIDGTNVAYCELVLGRAEAAEARVRKALASVDATMHLRAGHALDVLMLALAQQGRYEEALATGRLALADLKADGDEFRLLESLALIAAEQGRLEAAAWVAGHVDAVMAVSGEVRWPFGQAWRDRLDRLLDALPGEALEAQRSRGRYGTLEQAFDAAFGDGPATVS